MADILLIVEDEKLLGSELSRHYQREGWEVYWTQNLLEARQLLLEQDLGPLVVLTDMNLPDGNALDLLEQVRAQISASEWLFLTGYGSVADSVRALRLGAYDFLEKPCELDRLNLVIEGAARSARAQRRLYYETRQQHRRYTVNAFVGNSQTIQNTRALINRLTQVPFSALIITGETGTGKGLAARILHHSGRRAAGPLVELNCAALPKELVEAELFGYEAGAFTGAKGRHHGLLEQAHDGTLFLDEIGELELNLQGKLLKAVEDRSLRRLGGNREIHVDVQIIAATNRNLQQQIKEGSFRSDLYHRLSVFKIDLPPLRQRKEDLQQLVPLLIEEFNANADKKVRVVPDRVWQALYDYDWPGNVRELRNVIERCVLLADTEVFPAQWMQLPASIQPEEGSEKGDTIRLPLDGSLSLHDMEQRILQSVLERTGYNVAAAARLLGTTRETLRYRVQKYGLEV